MKMMRGMMLVTLVQLLFLNHCVDWFNGSNATRTIKAMPFMENISVMVIIMIMLDLNSV